MILTCPVCDATATRRERDPGRDAVLVDCPHCGNFAVSGSLEATLPHLRTSAVDASAKLSHALRRAAEAAERPQITTYTAAAVLMQTMPRPREQADLLGRGRAGRGPGPGGAGGGGGAAQGAI